MSTHLDDGTPVVCSSCGTRVAVYEHPTDGVQLVCDCPHTAVTIDSCVATSSLFTPLTGRWSMVDEK